MSDEKKCDLSPEDRDRIIRKIVGNLKMSRKEIDEKAGISSRGKGREEILLKHRIRDNTPLCLVSKFSGHYMA